MPLVRRQIVRSNRQTTYSRETATYTCYVPPDKVKATDVVVPVGEIPSRQLAELGETYPEEYGKAAEESDAQASPSAQLTKLAQLPAKELASRIREMDEENDAVVLWGIMERELDREDGARKTVLEALAAKGVEVEGEGEGGEGEEDDGEDGEE